MMDDFGGPATLRDQQKLLSTMVGFRAAQPTLHNLSCGFDF